MVRYFRESLELRDNESRVYFAPKGYHIYSKYNDTLTPYRTCTKNLNNSILLPVDV